MPPSDVGLLVLNVLFTKPGLPTRSTPGDEQLLCSIGGVPVVWKERHGDILDPSVIEEAISRFGVQLISDCFRNIFRHSASTFAVTHVISYLGPIFTRFCAFPSAAQQFQIDDVQVPLMRMTWEMVRTADEYGKPGTLPGGGMTMLVK